jgi:hypothetical protein
VISELGGHGTSQALTPVVWLFHYCRKACEDRYPNTHRQQQRTWADKISMVPPHEHIEARNDKVE